MFFLMWESKIAIFFLENDFRKISICDDNINLHL